MSGPTYSTLPEEQNAPVTRQTDSECAATEFGSNHALQDDVNQAACSPESLTGTLDAFEAEQTASGAFLANDLVNTGSDVPDIVQGSLGAREMSRTMAAMRMNALDGPMPFPWSFGRAPLGSAPALSADLPGPMGAVGVATSAIGLGEVLSRVPE